MKKIVLHVDGRFKHWHTIQPESEAIEVSDSVAMLLSQNPQTKMYDSVSQTVVDFVQSLIVSQQHAVERIELSRNTAMFQPLLSNALGTDHTYTVSEKNNNFLNNLITIGNGSKFTCTDSNNVKARRFHTDQQLRMLAVQIEQHISAQFDKYEAKINQIALAQNQTDLDNVTW